MLCVVCVFVFFVVVGVFFYKQKTAYEMRISDWSSDVCSSDLRAEAHIGGEIDPEVARRLTQPRFAFAARARFCDAESARDIGIAAAIDADEDRKSVG